MPPLRYNAISVLRNINLADVDEIKDVMESLARCLDTTASADAKRMAEQALALLNKGPILRIVRGIERNHDWPLLRMAVDRLLQTRNKSRLEILGAVSELEHLAEEKVLMNPTVHFKAYQDALDNFLDLPALPFGEEARAILAAEIDESATTSSGSSQSDHQVTPTTPEGFHSDDTISLPSVEKSQSKSSTDRKASQNTIKPAAPRKPLPSLPNSKVVRTKYRTTNPRKKRTAGPVPLSEEYAIPSPPSSSPTTPKRGKATKACDECRRRKTKCLRDEGDDKCNSCLKMGRDCILSTPSPAKSSGRGTVKKVALEDPFTTTTKTAVTTPTKTSTSGVKRKSSAKSDIFTNFGNLKEGKTLGIVADADAEDSLNGTADAMDIVDEVKVAVSDSEDYDYKPSKRVCRPGKGRALSLRKTSAILVE